jgi:hypothetical protein
VEIIETVTKLFGAIALMCLVIILVCCMLAPEIMKEYLNETGLEEDATKKKKELDDLFSNEKH